MSIDRELAGARAHPGAQFTRPQRATVRRTGADGVFVTLDRLDDTRFFGPCRWARPAAPDLQTAGDPGHDHSPAVPEAYPPTGTRCLVLFSDLGAADPWIVAFDGWPAGG